MKVEELPEWQGEEPGRPSSQQDNHLIDENFIYIYKGKALEIVLGAHSKWRNIHSRKSTQLR